MHFVEYWKENIVAWTNFYFGFMSTLQLYEFKTEWNLDSTIIKSNYEYLSYQGNLKGN